jgi:hypothetical protein
MTICAAREFPVPPAEESGSVSGLRERLSFISGKKGGDCRLQKRGCRAGKIRPDGDHNVTGRRKNVPVPAKDLSEHALDPIATDGPANEAVHTDSQPAGVKGIGQNHQGKTRSLEATAVPVHLRKLPGLPEKGFPGKSEPFHLLTRTDVFCPWPVDS